MKKNQLVVKSNDLVNAAYRLSLVEQRLLLACIAQIDSRDALTEEDVFEITASEIMDLLGESAQRGTIYRDLKTATERLWGRTISFSDNENHYGKRRWITEVDYFLNEGRVRIRFSRDVIKYLSGLKSAFTQYKLEYVAHFKSSYSVRIYELLVQWMSTGEREISVDELREKLVLGDKYQIVSEMKRQVLDKAVKDINKYSNIRCSYGQRKLGRKVIAFQFKFKLKDSTGASGKNRDLSKIGQLVSGSTQDARPGETMIEYLARKKRDKK